MYLVLIFSVAVLIVSLPRTLDRLSNLGLVSACFITLAGLLAMIAAGRNPVPGRVISATIQSNFFTAFLAITNPVSSSMSYVRA